MFLLFIYIYIIYFISLLNKSDAGSHICVCAWALSEHILEISFSPSISLSLNLCLFLILICHGNDNHNNDNTTIYKIYAHYSTSGTHRLLLLFIYILWQNGKMPFYVFICVIKFTFIRFIFAVNINFHDQKRMDVTHTLYSLHALKYQANSINRRYIYNIHTLL